MRCYWVDRNARSANDMTSLKKIIYVYNNNSMIF